MGLGVFIRITLIKVSALFYFSKRSKVIFYHDIHDVTQYTDMSTSIELFIEHINIIRASGYEIVSKITKTHGQIEICFDDAFLGLYDNVSFIEEQKIPIHLFVITSYLRRENYINEKQLLAINKSDLIKISSHTHTHNLLNQMNKNEIERELKKSKKILENLLSVPVDAICYPEGRFNKKTIHIAKKIGYKKQYSSLPGFFNDKLESNVIRRSLVQFAAGKEFKAILKGGDHILAFWYKLKHFKK